MSSTRSSVRLSYLSVLFNHWTNLNQFWRNGYLRPVVNRVTLILSKIRFPTLVISTARPTAPGSWVLFCFAFLFLHTNLLIGENFALLSAILLLGDNSEDNFCDPHPIFNNFGGPHPIFSKQLAKTHMHISPWCAPPFIAYLQLKWKTHCETVMSVRSSACFVCPPIPCSPSSTIESMSQIWGDSSLQLWDSGCFVLFEIPFLVINTLFPSGPLTRPLPSPFPLFCPSAYHWWKYC